MTQLAVRSSFWGALFAAPLLLGATPTAPSATHAPLSSPHPGDLLIDPATGEVTGEVTPFIQPFDLDATRRMAVPVMVGGQGPFSFLVDTGAERTVIARELADRLKLVEGAKLRLATIGSSTTVASYRVAALQMTDLHMGGFEAPAFAGRHIGAAGLIGVDMLEQRRVLIDFRKESMAILETKRRARPIIRDEDAIVVTARTMAGRLILSQARIDGRRIDVIVDTGAQTSVGNPALQRLVAQRRQHRLPFSPTILNAVSGEEVPAVRTAINRISIDGIEVTDLPVSFADAQAFRALGLADRPALLLGMDSLALFDRIEIDFPNQRVIFDMPSGAQRGTAQRFAASTARYGG